MLYKKYSLLLPKLLIYENERCSTVFHFCSKTRMYQTVLQFFIFFLMFYKSYYIFLKSLVKQLSNEVLHLTFTYIQAELWTVQRKLWYNCSKSAWCVRGGTNGNIFFRKLCWKYVHVCVGSFRDLNQPFGTWFNFDICKLSNNQHVV